MLWSYAIRRAMLITAVLALAPLLFFITRDAPLVLAALLAVVAVVAASAALREWRRAQLIRRLRGTR